MICVYKCVVCGTDCRKHRAPANTKTPPKYCSQKCHGIDKKGTGLGVTPNVHFECKNCGKQVSVYRAPSHPNREKAAYCSLKCLGDSQRGTKNPSFNTGRHILNTGYVVVLDPSNPMADVNGYVLEHRKAMGIIMERPLESFEIVHHIDGNPGNNSIENLKLFESQAEHLAYHRSSK